VNEEARDGTFGFTVDQVVSNNYDPQGIYVGIGMWVENIGRSQQRYFPDYQRLLDSKERLFSPDLRQAVGRPEYEPVDINPGIRFKAGLWFDVPKGTTPSQYVLVLHASPDSPGVTVRLPDSYGPPPPR
jgi:hypothetical protein